MGRSAKRPMRVPFRDLPRAVAADRAGWEPVVLDMITGGDFQRPNAHIERFERRFAEWCGTRHAVATSSGTAAIMLAYLALELGRGDEIVTVANTFVATVEPARLLGATPILVDIERDGYGIDPAAIASALTERTAAIVPFHAFGRLADVATVANLARERSVPVVEEACQAHGAARDGKRAGAWGDLAVFSFGPTKPLAGLGEGGAVTTDSDDVAERLRHWSDHGRAHGDHVANGLNFRIHPLEAAFLDYRLDRLDSQLEERRAVAAAYNEAFAGLGIARQPIVDDLVEHAYYLYVVEVADRPRFRAELDARGIESAIHYPAPIHRQAAHRDLTPAAGLPVTDEVNARIVSLPLFPGITPGEVEAVIAAVCEVAGRGAG